MEAKQLCCFTNSILHSVAQQTTMLRYNCKKIDVQYTLKIQYWLSLKTLTHPSTGQFSGQNSSLSEVNSEANIGISAALYELQFQPLEVTESLLCNKYNSLQSK